MGTQDGNPPELRTNTPRLRDLEKCLDGANFRGWRRKQKYRENIRDNNPEYNEGGYSAKPTTHLPHQLHQCHRKTWYRERNAPQETPQPDGIFSIGSWIEEEIIAPWLADLAESWDAYFVNDLWLEATVEQSDTVHKFRGATDPAICDASGEPLLITEIKTKESLTKLSGPKDRHKAQLAAYQYAASDEYEISPPVGYLIYVGKKRFDVQTYRIEFDPDFFRSVVIGWVDQMSEYRMKEELPPAEPIESWECQLCEFRSRCGQTEKPWDDQNSSGFLPLVVYPRDSVLDYIASHEDPILTPTLAHHYPDLADEVPVADWRCERCDERYEWDSVNWDGSVDEPPTCDRCTSNEQYAEITGPVPNHPKKLAD